MQRIYLDNNATTRVLPEVASAMDDAWQNAFANPGSQHSFGRDARRVLEDSRDAIAQVLDCEPDEVVFTSGGTESINTAVQGLISADTGVIALTAGEHPATIAACERVCQRGLQMVHLHVDNAGRLVEDQFDNLPWNELRLVCIILAHNETGVVQDLTRLSELCQQHGVPLMVDAVQAVGKIPVSFRKLNAAVLAFGAHKFHGPRGIGGMLVRRDVRIPPIFVGGHQEHGRRAGTEPVALIAGMTAALTGFHAESSQRIEATAQMRNQLQQRLLEECSPVIVHGAQADRLPNTLSIAFPGVDGEALLVNLDLEGIACSLGSTCASGSAEPAPSLLAMGVPKDVCTSSVRFSVSCLNTLDEINEAADRIAKVVYRLRSQPVAD